MIVMYSTGCPKCRVLEAKLAKTGRTYTIRDDVDEMKALGFTEVPVLEVDGKTMLFNEAVKWANDSANFEPSVTDCSVCKL